MPPAVGLPESTTFEKMSSQQQQPSTVVPPCPARLAFTREDFLSDSFSVDAFLSRKTASIGLESLRDDLAVYHKVLQSAMIELINQDYADFVNLSSNLVGLDDRMLRIEDPLRRFHDRAIEVRQSLQESLAALKSKLAEREALQAKRVALQNLEHVVNTLNKIERLLGLGNEDNVGDELSGDLVERVAADVNYLNFCVSKCAAPAFVDEIKPRIQLIGDRLQGSLEAQLLDAISQDNRDALKRCLRVYATIDKISDAQLLVRKRIVAPYLDDVISKQSLNEDPQGLKGLLQRVNKIISAKLELLVQLTQHQSGVLRDFDFLIQSLWVEIVEKFDENLSNIFSAGDPDKFHSNYTTMFAWLDEFEKRLGDIREVENFRSTPSYSSFIGRWDLSLYSYYQIRFQEIAMPVELAVESMFERTTSGGRFRLLASDVVMTSVRQCWDPLVHLNPLTHRFWKLTLQIFSRYTTAASKSVIQKAAEVVIAPPQNLQESKMRPSPTTANLKSGPHGHRMTHSRSASDQGGQALMSTGSHEKSSLLTEDEIIGGLVCLFLDMNSLSIEKESILSDIVVPALPSNAIEHVHLLEKTLAESFDLLLALKNPLVDRLVEIVTARCLPFLKQVSDIPRLYRRTNRDLPSKPCTYMTSLLAPIQSFHSTYITLVESGDVIKPWLVQMFIKVCDQYQLNVSDVLAAVQKMEESLQRLKKVRGGASSNVPGSDSRAAGMSDDDKIRLQLFVDVQHLIVAMQTVGVDKSQVPSVIEVEKLVHEATKSCYEDYLAKMSTTS